MQQEGYWVRSLAQQKKDREMSGVLTWQPGGTNNGLGGQPFAG